MLEGVTDAPCGEHGAGTAGFVLYVALSRGGELCPAQSHPCTVLYCTVLYCVRHRVTPAVTAWTGAGCAGVDTETSLMKTSQSLAATLLHQEVAVLSPPAASTSAVSPRLQL